MLTPVAVTEPVAPAMAKPAAAPRRKTSPVVAGVTEVPAPDTAATDSEPVEATDTGAPEAPPPVSMAETQAFLAQQGYYSGPIDGVVSPALKAAAAAYMADRPIARDNPER